MRNIDRLGSPPISGANSAKRVSRSSISSRIGWRTSDSYSSRCASNQGFSLCRASPRKKVSACFVNGIAHKIRCRRALFEQQLEVDEWVVPVNDVAALPEPALHIKVTGAGRRIIGV